MNINPVESNVSIPATPPSAPATAADTNQEAPESSPPPSEPNKGLEVDYYA